MLAREIGNEALIGIRFLAAQLVVEVGDEEDHTKLFAQLQQQAQEGDGVGSAGDGYGYAIARAEADCVRGCIGARVRARDDSIASSY